uniref:Uncharacterized protein n=1 Tax=Chromera velia CCMP2878 TaxID=1169474 RepID=A0A0G4F8V4_9ALVE|eukprot:Cvel_15618.t1-p1 / transcript=Cvel_15618.t1 / gene=Cvel_15618 / organism=Chromera_velia_CCMP2878 / gene_product=hypothetical protein / transcript_product=hypothetical protein / location=Cvel_scaffold1162:39197-48001(-) / protein_length=1208 / sequence_SO=supercontig / SO=protein_coding / is_pseudo=false
MRSRNLLFGLGAVLASASDFPTQEQAEAFFELATVNGTSCSFVLASEADPTLGLFADPAADAPQPTGLGQIADGPQEAFEWLFVPAENGTVNIVNKASSNCLEATGSDAAVFADVCDSSAEQEWNAVLNENGDPPEYDFTSPAFGNDFLANGALQTGPFGWDRDNGTCVDLPSKGKFPYIPKLYGATHYKSWDHIPFPNDYLGCDFAQQPGFFPSAYYDKSGSYKSDWTDYYGSHQIKAADPHPKLLLGVEAIPSALVNDPAFPDVANKTMQFMENPYYFLKKSVSWKRVLQHKSSSLYGHTVTFESGFGPTDFNAVHEILPYAVALNQPENKTEHKDWWYIPEKTTPLEMLAKSVYFQIEQNNERDKPDNQPYPVDYFYKLDKLDKHVAFFLPVFHYELFDHNWLIVLDVDFVGKPKDPQYLKVVAECGAKFKVPGPPAVSVSAFAGGDDSASSSTGDDGSSSSSSSTSNPSVGNNENDVSTGAVSTRTGEQDLENNIGPINSTSVTGDSDAYSNTGPVTTDVSAQNGPNDVRTGGSTADGTVDADVGNNSTNINSNNATSVGVNQNEVDTSSDNDFKAGINSTSNAGSDVDVYDENTNGVVGNVNSTIDSSNDVDGSNANNVTLEDNSDTNVNANNNNTAVQSNTGSIEGSNTASTSSGSSLNATLDNDSSNDNDVSGSVNGTNTNEVDASSKTTLDTTVTSGSQSGSDVDVQDTNEIELNPDVTTGSSSQNNVTGVNDNALDLTDSSDRSTVINTNTSSEQSNFGSVNSINVVETDADISGSVEGAQNQTTNVDTTDVNTNAGTNEQGQSSENESGSVSESGSNSESNNNVTSNSKSYTGDSISNATGGDSDSAAISNSGGNIQNYDPTIIINIKSNNNFTERKKSDHEICAKVAHDLVDDFFATHEDTPLNGNVLINDPPGWKVIPSATSPTTAEGGTVIIKSPDGHFEYTPKENFVGIDFFFYTAKKEVHGVICKATARVTIKVIGKDDGPIAKDLTFTLNVDCAAKNVPALQGRAEAHDPDTTKDHLTYPLLSRPDTGVLEWNEQTGFFVYTPPADTKESFQVSWEYAARDKSSESPPATITVFVEVVGDCKVKSSSGGLLGGGMFGGDFLKLDGFKFPGLDGFKLGDMGMPDMGMPGLSGAESGAAIPGVDSLDLGVGSDFGLPTDFGSLPVADVDLSGASGDLDKLPGAPALDLKGFFPQ